MSGPAQTRGSVTALVSLYLTAIVAANLLTARFGPTASIYNAFALIGLDLITRDRLADFWGYDAMGQDGAAHPRRLCAEFRRQSRPLSNLRGRGMASQALLQGER
jgi:hypothetical protein